ncbi:hypothetical protein MHYP_G00202710 [Metynnis hypsauchen]
MVNRRWRQSGQTGQAAADSPTATTWSESHTHDDTGGIRRRDLATLQCLSSARTLQRRKNETHQTEDKINTFLNGFISPRHPRCELRCSN